MRAPRLSALVAAAALWLAPASAQQTNSVNLGAVTNLGVILAAGGGAGTVVLGSANNSLLGNYNGVLFTVTGLTGTLVPEGLSCDSAGTWTALTVTKITTGATGATITSDGVYSAFANGFCRLRLRGATVSADTAVTITANYGTPLVTLTATISGTVSSNIAQWGGAAVVSSLSGAPGVGGDAAAGSTNSGNPVKIGGVNVPSTVTSGQRGDIGIDTKGNQTVVICGVNTNSCNSIVVPGESVANASAAPMESFGATWNGGSWDRFRGNIDTAALVTLTAAGAGTTNSADQTNYNGRCVIVVADITVAGGTIAVTVAVQGKDAASGKYYSILTSASLITTGTTPLTVCPGNTVTTNVSAASPLPRTWRVQVVSGAGVTPAVTMTVGASVIN